MERNDLDGRLEAAQAAVLDRLAHGTRARRVRWSRGETRVLELGDGPPLVLVHGFMDNAALWAPILGPLAARHRVIAVDLPGHGLADPFDYADADLQDVARTFLREVLDALELESAALVGSSLGGFVCTVFTLDAPTRVTSLVLVGAPVGVTREVPAPLFVIGLLAGLPGGRGIARRLLSTPTRESLRKLMGQIAVAHPERLDDGMLDADVLGQERNRESYVGMLRYLGGARGLMPLVGRLVLGERWDDVAAPTLLLRGERDRFVTSRVEAAYRGIAARNPNVRIVPVEDAGHLLWLDAPDAVVREIEGFLEDVPAGAAVA
ncbi:MAG TPA: alpha/beta fold hydrolase [Gaiella sp.]|uniref:alpha/beta fold hydrolase n=1 Tax=Gaiella sp. TaxID=2663207 RepID=UPI002D7E94A6|nr:alpha/beta fold hydrolase [Gaiella sp.]HET9286363.1 alpha/beta fold hydrolase [Gaiella sp.]